LLLLSKTSGEKPQHIVHYYNIYKISLQSIDDAMIIKPFSSGSLSSSLSPSPAV